MKYLTKSIFKQALTCPTKLYYATNSEYGNQTSEDTFLQALAEGGFQVGALATRYYPGGIMIDPNDTQAALEQTAELLKLDEVIIYEATIAYKNLLVKVDILEKKGDVMKIIEVKAKSYNEDEDDFISVRGGIKWGWQEYIADIAYQKYVIDQAYPFHHVRARLLLVDKTATCPTDGLNQKFKLVKSGDRHATVEISPDLTEADLATRLLVEVDVDECCRVVYLDYYPVDSEMVEFEDFVMILAKRLNENRRIATSLGKKCGQCEFKVPLEFQDAKNKSGFHQCFKEKLGWRDPDFHDATVLELWNFRDKDKYLLQGIAKLKDIDFAEFGAPAYHGGKLTTKQRQWLQIEKETRHDKTPWLARADLIREIESWQFPLHFIDFETSMVAIPFTKGRHPYEPIAFEFSHHQINADGTIEHRGQYLNATPGAFPNYEFVRALKAQLEHDHGTIFRYADHENTYLNLIWNQLQDEDDLADGLLLCTFIESITHRNGSAGWCGPRDMVDLRDLVKNYYYDPMTHGSNSIKYVLPAILNSSDYLKTKYSKPIYGTKEGIKSLNYHHKTWLVFEGDKVLDPYGQLPPIFTPDELEEVELLSQSDRLQNGGAALVAYAKMQFTDMSAIEREKIASALLRYCELDTMAMVMLYEGLRDLVGLANP